LIKYTKTKIQWSLYKLNKTESCINWTLNKVPLQEIFVQFTCKETRCLNYGLYFCDLVLNSSTKQALSHNLIKKWTCSYHDIADISN
jgi:hypothetical protein